MLRGVVHWRPGDGYRRFTVLEQEAVEGGAAAPAAPAQGSSFLVSASAWHLAESRNCAVSIDVKMGTLQPHLPDAEAEPDSGAAESFPADSRQRLLGRHATHALVLPLRAPGTGVVEGMICLEADCMAAVGQDPLWPECGEELQLMASVAAPYLATLPPGTNVPSQRDEFLPVVGAAISGLVSILRVFAQQEETILISGPTGTGKSRLARWCHEQSGRRKGRFESLDLMTIPEELQMAELFGWRKGAFTGALHDNPGSVARAEGGTLFIDEIDKLSLKAQAGLLHMVEERSYRRLGEGMGDRQADVRFIVGTNADLRAAVKEGRFREDLYYRINVLPVRLPPLDERRDEIPQWARYMVNRRHQSKYPTGEARLSAEAERLLGVTSWPGNLRQLDNIVRRAYTLAMVENGGASPDVLLQELHVRRALGYESPAEHDGLVGAMYNAARLFVLGAQGAAGGWDLDLAESFKGFVTGVAVQQFGRDQAFRLLGRESLVKNRNHYKALRRELDRVDALLRQLGHEPSPFADLMAEPDERSGGDGEAGG
ncbi:MAG TPA: sigma 54-interacting transcriptional regulator [Myxococcaceae bacterium]|nr:sigma 54-interacting transcriptional regulator [Myxococcaceae bacterium]